MAIYVEEATARLAGMLAGRRSNNEQPILFLGEGVARAAGIPSVEDIARDLYSKNESYLPTAEPGTSTLLETFYHYWNTLQPYERQSLLQSYFARVPVPDFYFDLVQLLTNGYFVNVLTTSIDTLLEQALDFSGRVRGKDYGVASLAQGDEPPAAALRGLRKVPVRILKLHGDLSGPRVAVTPEEIEKVLLPQRTAVKDDFLSGELVLAGYRFESEPMNQWLGRTTGDLWWVSVERFDRPEMSDIENAHNLNRVEGPNADPKEFFGILRLRLQAQSEPVRKGKPISKFARSLDTYPPEAESGLESAPSGDTDIERQFLTQRLDMHMKRKRELEAQALYAISIDQDTETQIKYEGDSIAQIQQRLDELR